MKVPILGAIDERFLMHRLRSTANAGLSAVAVAAGLFFYALSSNVIRWDYFAIIAIAAAVKIGSFVYYRRTD
jgi:hypothetical protein